MNLGRLAILEDTDILLLDRPPATWTSTLPVAGYIRSFHGTVVTISHDRYSWTAPSPGSSEIRTGKVEFTAGITAYAVRRNAATGSGWLVRKEQAKIAQLWRRRRSNCGSGLGMDKGRAISMEGASSGCGPPPNHQGAEDGRPVLSGFPRTRCWASERVQVLRITRTAPS